MYTEFPPALEELSKVLGGLSLGIEVASPECAVDGTSFYTKFLVTLLALFLILLVLMGKPLREIYRTCGEAGIRAATLTVIASDMGAFAFRDVFVVILLLHPSISGKAMEFFRCRTIDDVSYLMADYSLECYDGTWYAFLPVVLAVLLLFSFGTPLLMAYVLYSRRTTLYNDDGTPIPQSLDVLFAIYQPKAYWYESVQMVFKLGLWAAFVFFTQGSEMQLATALVVNVLQLCLHLIFLPFGGVEAWLLNVMQACTLVLTTRVNALRLWRQRALQLIAHFVPPLIIKSPAPNRRYLNFGALCLLLLEVTQNFAEYRNDDTRTEDVDSQISIIEGLMTFLTYSLFITFAADGTKKAFVKARSLDAAEIGAKIKNLCSCKKKPSDEAAEFETRAAAEIELSKRRSNLSSVQSEEEAAPSSNSNPMLSGDEPGAVSTTITQQASVTLV